MKTHYFVIEEAFLHPDSGSYTGFGICAQQGRMSRKIHDLSTDRQKVYALTRLLNREQPAAEHLLDILYNWVIDQ